MASFEGALASVPGLAGYLAKRQLDEQQTMQGIQQAGGLLALKNQIDAQNEGQMVRGILASSPDLESAIPQLSKAGLTGITAATHLESLNKARQDADMTKAISGMLSGTGGKVTPEIADAVAMKLGAAGKVGGQAWSSFGERLRKEALESSALASMRSQGAVGEAGPQIPQAGGVPPFLLNSPFVGDSAKALLDRINAGAPGLTSTSVEKNIEQLATAHNTAKQAQALVALRGDEQRKTKAIAPAVNAAGVLEPEAIDRAAARYRVDGSLPPNLGRGNQSAINTSMILNRAAKLSDEEGETAEAARIRQISNKSSTLALNALNKDLAAIGPFHDMLNTNAKIAIDLAKKISSSRTGSQLANRPLTWLQNNASDNPDIAEYLFQMQTVKTEGARILNNPRLVGQLTDSARTEMGNVVNGNMPLGQTERVLKRMMSDGDNRVNAMTAQKETLLKEMGGAKAAPSGPRSFASEAEAEKAGVKPGERVIINGVPGTWR